MIIVDIDLIRAKEVDGVYIVSENDILSARYIESEYSVAVDVEFKGLKPYRILHIVGEENFLAYYVYSNDDVLIIKKMETKEG